MSTGNPSTGALGVACALGPLHPRADQVLHEGEASLECPCCVLFHIFCNQVSFRTTQVSKVGELSKWFLT